MRFIDPPHHRGVDENQDDKDVYGALLCPPEAKLEAKIELTPAQQKCRQYQNAQLKAMKLAESGFNNRHMFVSIWFTNNDPIARDRFPAPAEQAAAWASITKSTGWDCGEMLNLFHG